jgi:hypothetical protein
MKHFAQKEGRKKEGRKKEEERVTIESDECL